MVTHLSSSWLSFIIWQNGTVKPYDYCWCKVFLLFLIVDIISNCQTIIIDNYTKNRGNFFEWNEYNFDDIDNLMLKRKDNCLKAKIFFQDG
jgi:hypothetical protein